MIVVAAAVVDVLVVCFGWRLIATRRQRKRAALEYGRGLAEALVTTGLSDQGAEADRGGTPRHDGGSTGETTAALASELARAVAAGLDNPIATARRVPAQPIRGVPATAVFDVETLEPDPDAGNGDLPAGPTSTVGECPPPRPSADVRGPAPAEVLAARLALVRDNPGEWVARQLVEEDVIAVPGPEEGPR
jgi:hypothetical protein